MATKKAQPKTANTALLKNARITEKAALASQFNIYLFDVAVNATKNEIAKAFEAVYKQKPIKVNTMNVVRKSYFRKGKLGFGAKGKKAYVFLPKGTKIEIM
jgi:large subunit ribosomal protein L23